MDGSEDRVDQPAMENRKFPWDSDYPDNPLKHDSNTPRSLGSTESDMADQELYRSPVNHGPDIPIHFSGGSQSSPPLNGLVGSSGNSFSGGQSQLNCLSASGFAGVSTAGNMAPEFNDQMFGTPPKSSSQIMDTSPGSTPEAVRVSGSPTFSVEQRREPAYFSEALPPSMGTSTINQEADYTAGAPQDPSHQRQYADSTSQANLPHPMHANQSPGMQSGTVQLPGDHPGMSNRRGDGGYPTSGVVGGGVQAQNPQHHPHSVQVFPGSIQQHNAGMPPQGQFIVQPTVSPSGGVGIFGASTMFPVGFQGDISQFNQIQGQMFMPIVFAQPSQFQIVHQTPQVLGNPQTFQMQGPSQPVPGPGNGGIYPGSVSSATCQNDPQFPACAPGINSQPQWSPPPSHTGVQAPMEVTGTRSGVGQNGDTGHPRVMQSTVLPNAQPTGHISPPLMSTPVMSRSTTPIPQQHAQPPQQPIQYFHHPAPYQPAIPSQLHSISPVPVQHPPLPVPCQAPSFRAPEQGPLSSGGQSLPQPVERDVGRSSEVQPAAASASAEVQSEDQPVASDRPDDGKEAGKGEKGTLEARQYQMDFYRMARRRNIIAFLDTGAGKTFISVLLIKDVGANEKKWSRNGASRRAIFFLVPKKVLVGQQAHVLRTHTDLEIGEYCSDGGQYDDSWDRSRWAKELSKFHVFVMTPQILLTMLRHGFITMRKIALICFDECHHARKKHPYNLIMQEFYHVGAAQEELPKIFGMTASLVDKKSTTSCEQGFMELQQNLASMIMTADVGKFASKASQTGLVYQPSVVCRMLPDTERLLKQAITRLRVCNMMYLLKERKALHDGKHNLWDKPDQRKKLPCDHKIKQLSSINYILGEMGLLAAMFGLSEMLEEETRELSADERYSREIKNRGHMADHAGISADQGAIESLEGKLSIDRPQELWQALNEGGMRAVACVIVPAVKSFPAVLDDNFRNCDLCKTLSWWDAVEAMALGVLGSKEKVGEFFAPFRSRSPNALANAIRKLRLTLDMAPVSREVPLSVETDAVRETQVITTHKVIQLFRFLMNEVVGKGGAGDDWRGMIFVEQTISAVVLEQMIRSIPELTQHFRCQSLTGHGGSVMSTAMEDKHQRRIVKLFRDGEVNLLISTSVAEEGLDITDCRLVVRFDLPKTEAAYIQSRGRARRMNSMYIMFVERNNAEMMAQINRLQAAEESMKNYADFLRHNFSNQDADDGEDFISGSADARNEMLKSQREGALVRSDPNILFNTAGTARITSNAAITLIHRYCSQLPQDQYCNLRPHFLWCSEETPVGKQFQVQITLPSNCPVNHPIIGPFLSSKREAKAAVCLLACGELQKEGELDEHFLPSILSEKEALKESTFQMKEEARQTMNRDWVVENPINPKILRPIETAVENKTCGQGSDNQKDTILHLHIVDLVQRDNRVNKVDTEVVVPERIGIFTQRKIDQTMDFGLFPEKLEVDVSIRYYGPAEFDQDTIKTLKAYHFAILEGAYFKGKLFSSISTTVHVDQYKKEDFFSEIDGSLSFLTSRTAHQNPKTSPNKSWYLLTPLLSQNGEKFMDRLGEKPPSSSSHPNRSGSYASSPATWTDDRNRPPLPKSDWGYTRFSDDHPPAAEDLIDWSFLTFIRKRVENLRRPGAGVETEVKPGDVLMASHNPCVYRVLGVRMDLNLNSAFPAEPSPSLMEKETPQENARAIVEQEQTELMESIREEPDASGAGASAPFTSFKEFYENRHNMFNLNPKQPLIECTTMRHLSTLKRARNSLKKGWHAYRATLEDVEEAADEGKAAIPKDAPAKSNKDTKSAYKGPVHAVPELMVLHPLHWNVWRSLSIFVAVSWIFESLLKVEELGQYLCSAEFGGIDGENNAVPRNLFMPDVMVLYESITSKNCQEHLDYERLEFIGDALLKYVASMQLFWENPKANEGLLTKKREGLVSNTNLAKCCVNLNLHRFLRHVRLGDHPWRPAGCQFLDGFWVMMGGDHRNGATWYGGRSRKCSEENEQHQQEAVKVKYKTLADAMESLIGAFFVSGGLRAGIALIDRMGLIPAKFLLPQQNEQDDWIGSPENFAPNVPGLPAGLREFIQMQKADDFKNTRDLTVLESAIGYRIKNKRYFMEALTHVSWQETDPPCYQRLEYLGDAVLDMMVTRYMFGLYGYTNPGILTNLRMATVNNERLAIAAVKADLQKFVLHHSSYLQAHIGDFVEQVERSNRGNLTSFGFGDRQAPKVLGDVVESLIGATYLDTSGSLDATWRVWKKMLEPFCTPENVPMHPVTELMEACQFYGLSLVFERRPTPAGKSLSKSATGWRGGKGGGKWRKPRKPSELDQESSDEEWDLDMKAEVLDTMGENQSDPEKQKPRVNFQAGKSGKHSVSDVTEESAEPDVFVVALVDGVVKGEAIANHMRAARREAARNALEGEMADISRQAKQINSNFKGQDQFSEGGWGGSNRNLWGGGAGGAWQSKGKSKANSGGQNWGYRRERGGNRGWGRK
ncbi:hypothetical protein BSKO_13964 [Bryopsis sp. KO-2023]|nr:hypothetical protein BSKO_13964 [Bryopsis sp. KO-2023]